MSAAISHLKAPSAASTPSRATQDAAWVRWTLTSVALLFLAFFLVLPLAAVFTEALRKGFGPFFGAFRDSDALASIRLTLLTAAIAVPANVIFGVAAAWCIAKFNFRGKSVLTTLIDLPFAVSPVISGLIYVLVFGLQGWMGQYQNAENPWFPALQQWLVAQDFKIIFAVPGIVLATIFVSFPFVAREIIPVMEATGSQEEEAARVLGASGLQTFFRVTLPNIKWGLLYGIILCNARAMGEFGAVYVVSGHIAGRTDTMPLRVEKLFQEYNNPGSFAVASLLTLMALLTLFGKYLLERYIAGQMAAAQEGTE